ncbi:MAG: DNA replication and repair protein RecF [Candidatus Doudnabacteria bacterium]|nr:DNA replication and repair protein RecF [Candidatus Doudnabacteria bacterium]
MKIKELKVTNVRSLQSLDLTFDRDFVVLVGPNGSGKTTALECIFYSSLLQALPPGKTWELINFHENYFRIEVVTDRHRLSFYYGKKSEKKYERTQSVNGVRKPSSEILGALPCVTFLPQDLNILSASPAPRREYLDEVLLQTVEGYEGTLREYARVIAQRNGLLDLIKKNLARTEELVFWDERLALPAIQISRARQTLAQYIDRNLKQVYIGFLEGRGGEHRFHYQPFGPSLDEKTFLGLLQQSREADVLSSRTNVGPHRDDWKIMDVNNRDLSRYYSRGEQRGLIIALKVVETTYLNQILKEEPVILLDELFAELDLPRRQVVFGYLPPGNQKFLTASSAEEIPKRVFKSAQIIKLGAPA